MSRYQENRDKTQSLDGNPTFHIYKIFITFFVGSPTCLWRTQFLNCSSLPIIVQSNDPEAAHFSHFNPAPLGSGTAAVDICASNQLARKQKSQLNPPNGAHKGLPASVSKSINFKFDLEQRAYVYIALPIGLNCQESLRAMSSFRQI